MKRGFIKSKRFLEIIVNNNLCISENPKGLDINWPKSYAKLYYSQMVEEIFKNNQSPKILEINNNNPLKQKLWGCFFKNPFLLQENINNVNEYLKSKKIKKESNFEIIIINNYKNIKNIFTIIYLLKFKLAAKGIIIIENFHFSLPLISKIFFFFETNILDFRLNKFIINNCLIEIKNSSRFRNLIKTFTHFHKYIYHIFVDILYKSIDKLNQSLQIRK